MIRFDIRDEADINAEVFALLAEARRVGDQEHEHQSRRYRRAVRADAG